MTDEHDATAETPERVPLTERFPVEVRASTEPAEVNWPARTITVVAMPYEQETAVEYRGRVVIEVCHPGAFGAIETRAGRVKCNRDHDIRRPFGKVTMWDSRSERGLIADMRVSPTPLGDETLALAEDGVLGASMGFRLNGRDGERWEGRDRRHLLNLWGDHLSMVPDPAYEGAEVLAVRSALGAAMGAAVPPAPRVPTPNLDAVREMLAQQRYDAIR